MVHVTDTLLRTKCGLWCMNHNPTITGYAVYVQVHAFTVAAALCTHQTYDGSTVPQTEVTAEVLLQCCFDHFVFCC